MNSVGEFLKFKTPSPKPARIPPQTPPAGGNTAEAGRIHVPSQMFRPAESVQISSSGFSAKNIRTLSNKYRQDNFLSGDPQSYSSIGGYAVRIPRTLFWHTKAKTPRGGVFVCRCHCVGDVRFALCVDEDTGAEDEEPESSCDVGGESGAVGVGIGGVAEVGVGVESPCAGVLV
jgi:hypothetical protein